MKKSGRTAAGTQHWKCTTCNASTAAAASAASSLRSRRRSGPHPQETTDFALFISWITSSSSQARLHHGDDRAFRRRTSWCWQVPVPAPNPAARDLDQVFIDGIWLHHDWVLLIARTTTDVIGWQWAAKESTTAYQALLTPIPPPQVATTDGAPAALKAIATSWPTTRIQRCLIHVRRDTVCDLPLRPRTTQGRALLGLSRKLMTATTDQAATWVTALNSYATEYRTWLNQRTTAQDDPATAALTGKKWWYTHPRLQTPRTPHPPERPIHLPHLRRHHPGTHHQPRRVRQRPHPRRPAPPPRSHPRPPSSHRRVDTTHLHPPTSHPRTDPHHLAHPRTTPTPTHPHNPHRHQHHPPRLGHHPHTTRRTMPRKGWAGHTH